MTAYDTIARLIGIAALIVVAYAVHAMLVLSGTWPQIARMLGL
jgi:hypothetical protein